MQRENWDPEIHFSFCDNANIIRDDKPSANNVLSYLSSLKNNLKII